MNIPDDPFIQELIPEFVDSWLEDVDARFMQLIEEENADDFYRLAHTLKGSCFQFGLDEIANMGIELMGHVKNRDWATCRTYYQPVRNGFLTVKKYVEDNLSQS